MAAVQNFQTPHLHAELVDAIAPTRQIGRTCLDEIAAVLSPAVLEHLPDVLQLRDSPAPHRDWVMQRQAESHLYAVRDIGAGQLVGLLILADTTALDEAPTLRLGYMLAETAWGRGYATELVSGLVDALRQAGFRGQLLAGVARENAGSSRVLLKSGFVESTKDAQSTTLDYRLVLN